MFFNARNVLYDLNDNYNVEIESIISHLISKSADNIIEIDNFESFVIEIIEANTFIHINTFSNILLESVNKVFSNLITSLNIELASPNKLIVKLIFKTHFPLDLEGVMNIDNDKTNIVFNISKIRLFKVPFTNLFDVFSKIPGFSFSYINQDETIKIKNNSIIIYPKKFLNGINLNYKISVLNCLENGIQLFFKNDEKQLCNNFGNLDPLYSFVVFKEGKIKFHNILITNSNIIIKRDDSNKLKFCLTNLDPLLESNHISYNHNREVSITIK